MFLLVRILVLKRTDWDIRPAGSGIYEKGTFTGRDFIPGSYPSLCFIPPSLRSHATLVLHECVTCLGKRDPLALAPKKDEKHNHCSPLVFTRIEFPFSKATWGFSCVFAPMVLILVSLCYFGGARSKGFATLRNVSKLPFFDKIGHAKSVGFRFYSAIWRSETELVRDISRSLRFLWFIL